MEGTIQTNAMNAIRMIVFKNCFSLRILISCARLSVEFCKAMFLECFFNVEYVAAYMTAESTITITPQQ